jgi:hypothetical protein
MLNSSFEILDPEKVLVVPVAAQQRPHEPVVSVPVQTPYPVALCQRRSRLRMRCTAGVTVPNENYF